MLPTTLLQEYNLSCLIIEPTNIRPLFTNYRYILFGCRFKSSFYFNHNFRLHNIFNKHRLLLCIITKSSTYLPYPQSPIIFIMCLSKYDIIKLASN